MTKYAFPILAAAAAAAAVAAPVLETVTDKRGEKWAVYPKNRPDLDRIRAAEARAPNVPARKIEIEDPATGLTIPSPETARRRSGDRNVKCNSVTYDRMRGAGLARDPEYRAMVRCIKGR